jgi:protein deglycase
MMKKGHAESTKRCLVCVINGSEDIEFVSIVDTLRRSKHLNVTVAKVLSPDESHSVSEFKNLLECRLMQGVRIVADMSLESCMNETFDAIILPGGSGAGNMVKDKNLCNMLKH